MARRCSSEPGNNKRVCSCIARWYFNVLHMHMAHQHRGLMHATGIAWTGQSAPPVHVRYRACRTRHNPAMLSCRQSLAAGAGIPASNTHDSTPPPQEVSYTALVKRRNQPPCHALLSLLYFTPALTSVHYGPTAPATEPYHSLHATALLPYSLTGPAPSPFSAPRGPPAR